MNRAYTLLGVLLDYAPNGVAQAIATVRYNEMKADPHMMAADIEVTLASMIVDGLRYGNWPWSLNRMVEGVTELAKKKEKK